MYDVIIIGAGPAGSTLARLLPNTYKVLIMDKRNMADDTPRKTKACGGLISPDAQRMLATFDLGVPKEVLVDPQLFAVKVIDNDNNIFRFYQRNYLNINREKFDRYLASLIPNIVDKMYNATFRTYEKLDDNYKVTYTKNKQVEEVYTRYIIDASGGNSKIRDSLYPENTIKKYVSIQKWYFQEESINHYTAIFDKEISDYYQWTISKDNHLLVGTAIDINEENPHDKYELLEKKLVNQGFDLSKPIKQEGSFMLRPTKLSNVKTGKDNIYLIGEAAGLISPSSAEGYSYAFRSAMYLSKALSRENTRKSYKKQLLKLKLNLIYKKLKLPAMYNKTIRKWILKTNLMTIDLEK